MDVLSPRMGLGKRVILETSLKPFDKYQSQGVQEVCRKVYRPWQSLLQVGGEHSILLWVGSGEEVFLWNNDLSETIEWAHYIGHCHRAEGNYWDQAKHLPYPRNYRDDWGTLTYGELRNIVHGLRRVGREQFGIDITVGIGIDPGPEFCESEFPYRVHREILGTGTPAFIRCEAVLKEDRRSYAAYPKGIPNGEPFGRFLGKQSAGFCQMLGFDYIWFSNGLGFTDTPWLFPTADSLPEEISLKAGQEITEFWQTFKESFSEPVIEARGTNWSVGIDLSGKSVSMQDIYKTGLLRRAPVNPPTVFFTNSVGLEMTSFLSRISAFPGPFGFRYYISDPWFWQTPWFDTPYNRQPYDIYVPGMVTRLDEKGNVETAQDLALLTIDDRDGDIREDIAREVIPHLHNALTLQPDALGLVTWVYPFDEFHTLFEFDAKVTSREPFFYDAYAALAIDIGLPLNSVVSSTVFARLVQDGNVQSLLESVLFIPACLISSMGKEIREFIRVGGKVIFYGPLVTINQNVKELLGVEVVNAGFADEVSLEYTDFEGKRRNHTFAHNEVLSAGKISHLSVFSKARKIVAMVQSARGDQTPYAFLHPLGKGCAGWIRGSISGNKTADRKVAEVCMLLLGELGYRIEQVFRHDSYLPTQFFVSRNDNEFLFTGYTPDLTGALRISFPQGVPIPEGYDLLFEDGEAQFFFSKTIYERCRIFIRQQWGKVSCRRVAPQPVGRVFAQYSLAGLDKADITIHPPLSCLDAVTVSPFYEIERGTNSVTVRNVSGNLRVCW